MPETVLVPDEANSTTASWTRREILQQPETLRATSALLHAARSEIEAFVGPLLARPEVRIVLSGAGTSAFIGDCLAPWLSATLGRPVETIATTDIVASPKLHLHADRPMLIVSFGRSGNSPESIAAVDLADAIVRDVHHLVITCNPEGALARRASARCHVVVLPEATHDRAFAMTSSFSAMTLAALSILSGIAATSARADAIAQAVASVLDAADRRAEALAARDFERVVYLGSGVFECLVTWVAVTLLELTDGAIPTTFDSSLGFRHGPKTIVTSRTLVVVFVSNDPLTRRYDLDIISELASDGQCAAVLSVAADDVAHDTLVVPGASDFADVDLLLPYIVPAQLFGLHCSLRLGRTPDQPNATGTVNRVVQGVRIHDWTA